MKIRNTYVAFWSIVGLGLMSFFSACEEINLDDQVLDRGIYSGPVNYKIYVYLKDSSVPDFRMRTLDNQLPLKEDKKGLFIEYGTERYHFDNENIINITTNTGYIKYLRTNNEINVDYRDEVVYADSTVISNGSGTLKKQ